MGSKSAILYQELLLVDIIAQIAQLLLQIVQPLIRKEYMVFMDVAQYLNGIMGN